MSLGSIRELEAIIEIAGDLEYVPNPADFVSRSQEIAKMLTALIDTLN